MMDLGLVAVAFYAELAHQRSIGSDAVQLDNIIKGLTTSLTRNAVGFFLVKRIGLQPVFLDV